MRPLTPSFLYMFFKWNLTVSSVRRMRPAISLFDMPSRKPARICFSRRVSVVRPNGRNGNLSAVSLKSIESPPASTQSINARKSCSRGPPSRLELSEQVSSASQYRHLAESASQCSYESTGFARSSTTSATNKVMAPTNAGTNASTPARLASPSRFDCRVTP